MVKLIDKTKIAALDYLYLFIIVIYAAQASAFVRELGNPLSMGNIVIVVFTIVMMFVHGVKFSKNFAIIISIIIIYTILTFVRHSYVSGGFIPRWVIYLFISFAICRIYGERLFVVLETVLLTLIVISMVMWILDLLFPSMIHAIVERFSLPSFSTNLNYLTYNCVIYTINGEEDALLGSYYLFRRNAGFAWEPGAYSTFACLAIACNLIRKPDKLICLPVLIYLAAIATSQSTTGVFILAVMLLVWVIVNRRFVWAILLIPLAFYVYGLSFVSEKFSDELTDVITSGGLTSMEFHGRLYGLVASLLEFIQHPIIGLGGKQESYLQTMGVNASIFSGIGSLFTTFGLILSILFFVYLFKTEKYIRLVYNNYGGFYVVAVVIVSMFSYHLWEQPLFLSFAFLSVFGTTAQVGPKYNNVIFENGNNNIR